MTKAIVTGATGTLGTVLCRTLLESGSEVIAWDRSAVPVDDYHAMERFVRQSGATHLFHLAIASKATGRENEGFIVNEHWPSELAWITRQLGVTFLFTSSAMVFTDFAPGPRTLDARPDATEGYGAQKRRAEERVLYQNPMARIARLGWQIGSAPGSNNMIDFMVGAMQREGAIRPSTRWLPATSLIEDTAAALVRIAALPPGLYQVDSNNDMNFHEIALELNRIHGGSWRIEPNEAFVLDQRMIDPRVGMPDLRRRLAELPARAPSA